MSRWSGKVKEGAAGAPLPPGGGEGAGCFQMSRCRCGCRRVGTMSKVELGGRPEPGYESMEQFTVSVEHVAEMLRTIDFQPGEGARMGGGGGPLGLSVQTLQVGGRGMGARRPENRGLQLTQPSFRAGASGEEEDEEVALDGEEGSAGPEEERLEGPEGECGHWRGLPGTAPPRRSPSLQHKGSLGAPTPDLNQEGCAP